MPRRRKYGEVVDDHQDELVQALCLEGRVIPAYEPQDLPNAIAEARRRNAQPVPPPPSRMLDRVAQAIEEFLNQRK
jgi:UDP-N-acetylglucosamine transferase subunit ALG13